MLFKLITMKSLFKILALVIVAAFTFIGCQKDLDVADKADLKSMPTFGLAEFHTPQPTFPNSFRGVIPTSYPGNFVSSNDDQVCYDMVDQGLIGELTGDLRGIKVDPPVNFTNNYMDIALSMDLKFLAWASKNDAKLHAFIIKGGPNFHVYDYVGTTHTSDSWLASPRHGRNIPQISHYNFCYSIVPDGGEQGCTPGYWRNHTNRWEGYAPLQIFDEVFGVTLFGPYVTLFMVIDNPNTYGTFGFHAVAALLNSTGGVPNADGTTVDYFYTTAQVIQMVQDAVANDTMEATKNLFAEQNEKGCPLGGTRAFTGLY
jgi:hypothetical protein